MENNNQGMNDYLLATLAELATEFEASETGTAQGSNL